MKKIENLIVILAIPLLFWIAYIITTAADQSAEIKSTRIIMNTYRAECDLKTAQILDLMTSITTRESEAYSRGYEDGKIYMGMAQLQGKGMVDYADGYHAAISQYHLNQLGGDTAQGKENE
jgi:hypothetical protein